MKQSRIPLDLRISLLYIFFGGAWILFSDRLLAAMITDIRLLLEIAVYKGWLFVAFTGTALYFMLKRDLALHRRQEEQIRRSEERYRYLFNSNPYPMWIYDLRSLQFLAVNEMAVSRYGYTRDEFLKMTLADIRPLEDIPRLLEHLARPRQTFEYSEGWQHRLKDGSLIDVAISSHNLIDEGGGSVLVIAQDITERRRAENELRATARLMKSLLENMQTALLFEDQNRRIRLVNQSFCEIFNIPGQADTLTGMDSQAALQPLGSAAADGEAFLKGIEAHISRNYIVLGEEILLADGRILERDYIPIDLDHHQTGHLWKYRDISRRKRDEAALVESNAQFRTLFEASPEAIMLIDPRGDWPILDCNIAACQMNGYNRDELIGQSINLLSTPAASPLERSRLLQQIRENGVLRMETFHRHKNGTVFPIEVSTCLISLGGRDVVMGIDRDVSERKVQEAEIRSLARFPAENPSPVLRVNRDGLILSANQASADLLKLWEADAGGSMPPTWQPLLLELVRTGRREEMEVQCNDRVYSVLFVPIPEEHYINLYARDITENRKAELALRSAEEKYRTIFESAVEGIFQSTPDGRLLTANPALARMWGYDSPRDLIESINDLSHQIYVEPERRKDFVARMARDGELLGFEYRVYRKDGQIRWVSENSRAVKDAREAIQYYEGNIQDITERKQAEAALEKRAEELRILYETALEINGLPDMSSLLQVIVERAAKLVNAATGGIYLVRPDGESIELAVNYNLPDHLNGVVLRPGEGLSGRVIQTGEVMVIEDYSEWEGRAEIYKDYPFRRVLAVPLKVGDRIIGALNITDTQKVGSYDESDIQLVSMFANQAAIAIENTRLYEAIQSELAERRLMEQALLLTQFCVDRASIGIMRTGAEANILTVNDQMCRMLGYTADELTSMHVYDVDSNFPLEKWRAHRHRLHRNGSDKFETVHRRKDGTLFPVEVTNNYLEFQNNEYSFSFVQDISERKQAEADRERLLNILEASLNEIYIFDAESMKFQYVNTGARRNLGYSADQLKQMTPLDLKPGFTRESFRAVLAPLLHGEQEIVIFETVHRRADGSLYSVEVHLQLVEREAERVFLAVINDITERKQAEAALREREARYRGLFEDSPISLWEEDFSAVKQRLEGLRAEGVTDFRAYLQAHPEVVAECAALVKILDVNKATLALMHAKSKADLSEILENFLNDESMEAFSEELIQIAKGCQKFEWEGSNQTLDGARLDVHLNWSVVPGHETDLAKVIVSLIDVTERKQAEQALRESEMRLSTIFRTSPMAIAISRLSDHCFTDANDAFFSLTGYTSTEVLGHTARELNLWTDPLQREKMLLEVDEKGSVREFEFKIRQKSGQTRDMQMSADFIDLAGELCLLTIAQDITGRKQAEQKTHKHLKRITALRDIDRTISSSLDLQLTLNRLLGQVIEQLEVDAAAVLLFNPHTYALEYYAVRGVSENDIRNVQIQLGEDFAGKVALERRAMHLDLQNADTRSRRSNPLLLQGFVDYFGLPLIAKGQMRGVLEVFQRSSNQRDIEWLDYLDTLAGQAAIAIDNVQLFNGLQQTNLELTLAYDATIEGWSHALDLRDEETEGHTQRVTEMTLELARAFGFNQKDLTNLRWGALLHDIGKMGVPDAILLKPDKLTVEEWVVMKQHPVFAYEMLSRIHYLRNALDIPHYHHEKWDGTGYPRGLKGEQIPLAARIFAVADIWDALRSDRPYRPAWTAARALKYIREISGTHLDPRVVEVFLESKVFQK